MQVAKDYIGSIQQAKQGGQKSPDIFSMLGQLGSGIASIPGAMDTAGLNFTNAGLSAMGKPTVSKDKYDQLAAQESQIEGASSAPEIVSKDAISDVAPTLGKYLVPGKTGQAIGDTVAAATKAGASSSIDDFKNEVMQEIKSRFGVNSSEYLKAAQNRLSQVGGTGQPQGIERGLVRFGTPEEAAAQPKPPDLTSNDLVDMRQQAANRIKSTSGKLSMSSVQDKVDEVIRDAWFSKT